MRPRGRRLLAGASAAASASPWASPAGRSGGRCGAEPAAPISGQRAMRAEVAAGGAALRRGLRDGDRDDRRRGPRRLPAAASTSSTSSTGRPAAASPASSTARGSCATSPASSPRSAGRAAERIGVRESAKRTVGARGSPSARLRPSWLTAELVERATSSSSPAVGSRRRWLPRQTHAPISVAVDGTVSTLSGHRRGLRFITIAIDRGGGRNQGAADSAGARSIDAARAPAGARGLPRGRWSPSEPLRGWCRLRRRQSFPLQGQILAFNDGRTTASRATLAHVYGAKPYPNSRIFVFQHPQLAGGPTGRSSARRSRKP